jgi:hypothetical protein
VKFRPHGYKTNTHSPNRRPGGFLQATPGLPVRYIADTAGAKHARVCFAARVSSVGYCILTAAPEPAIKIAPKRI